jgi:regulatory protein
MATLFTTAYSGLLLKVQNYCAYQERSQQEVRNKLYEMGANKNEVEQAITELITTNYLNEERFAKAYVSGKFRIKNWGRNKIIYGLKQKGISSYCIKIGLKQIDEDEYMQTLIEVATKKNKSFKLLKGLAQKKLVQFLQGKGYESNFVWQLFSNKE